MTISSSDFIVGLTKLNELSNGEYRKSLQEVLLDPNEDLAFKRVGRLMAVWLKQPFALPSTYDPNYRWNWAKSSRSWAIADGVTARVLKKHRSQGELLEFVAADWKYPVESLHEFHIFRTLCKRLRPLVYGKSKTLADAERIAKQLRENGYNIKLLTTDKVIAGVSFSVATWLVQSLPWLSWEHLPLISGLTLLVMCFGQRKLRKFLLKFLKLPVKGKKTGHVYPLCGSVATKDSKPCRNHVQRRRLGCWKHRLRRRRLGRWKHRR